jgi:trimethylamine---corrinoid protein Co-methyltransferase
VVTGAFTAANLAAMFEMLALFTGGLAELAQRPQAVFDVCPTPPLTWDDFGGACLLALARGRIPAQLVSMPLAGAGGPVTLLGSIVQHAAESLSGIVIHQAAQPGAPLVWGGAPAIFDMRHGTTPMGAIETAMIAAAYTQVGRRLHLPTHGYLGASDAKLPDLQAGLETGMTLLIGVMAGIDLISGPGMLDFLSTVSAEKLVFDAEAIGMARRLLRGIEQQTATLALEFYDDLGRQGEFLKQALTRKLFRLEQYLPSPVIDRAPARIWNEAGRQDAFARACVRADELEAAFQMDGFLEERGELREMVGRLAAQAGMAGLPAL